MKSKPKTETVTERIHYWAEKTPNAVAMQIKRQGQYVQMTYRDLWERILGAASTLSEAGVKPGDTLGLLAHSGPEWIVAYFGIHLAGAVVTPLDAQYGEKEVRLLLDFAGAKGIAADRAHGSVLDAVNRNRPTPLPCWLIDPDASDSLTSRRPAENFQPRPVPWDEVMSIIFTSGTTGNPKGVQLTTGNISSNVDATLAAIQVTGRDNFLHILPLHHAYASTAAAFAPLGIGATLTFCESLKGPDLVAAMQETGVTILPGVPQLFALLQRSIFQKIDSAGLGTRMLFGAFYRICARVRKATGILLGKFLFRKIHNQLGGKIRFFVSGGAKLDPSVAEHLLNIGILTIEGYGLTETSPVISFTPLNRPKPGSVGLPLPGVEVKIDRPGAEGQGEILMRGPSLMKGYYKNEKATAEVIRDGWFHTGDLGFIDRDGMITITGRAKEVIVLPSGKNIYPDEVETRYQNTPLVKEICVLPRYNPDGSLAGLTAAVVPDAEELAARKVTAARERIRFELARTAIQLPSYMHLTDLTLLSEPLPRTRLGKLRRPLIEEMVRKQMKRISPEEAPELPEETRALLDHPLSRRFLKRLEEITGNPGPFLPSQDLEMDLGFDSLTLMQITATLEEEFALEIPSEEVAQVRTIGDILTRLVHAEIGSGSAEPSLSWRERLAAPPGQPLEEKFNLHRGFMQRLGISIAQGVLWILVKLLFRVRIEGIENIPRNGKILLCPNHQSYLDPVLIYALLPRERVEQLVFIAFGEIFARPPLSWVIRMGRIILTGGADTLEDSLRLSARALQRDMAVCIFPEGTRTNDGSVLEPRPGAGILARELGAPILPLLIDGAFQSLSPRHPGFRPCRIRMAAGAPIVPPEKSQFTASDYSALMKQWREAILKLKLSGEPHE